MAVGAAVEAGGVRLELIAVELRTDGGLATLVAQTPIGPASGASPIDGPWTFEVSLGN